jgi:tRNA(fMet)-specific endonuclease VapC
VKFLLDTDHISILQQQAGAEYLRLAARIAQHPPADLGFSLVSFHEQLLGCHTYIGRARTTSDVVRGYQMLGRVLADFTAAPSVNFDAAAGAEFDSLRAQRVRIATMDLRIAAVALAHNLVLLTRNVRDFGQVPGLQTQDWTV